jgi:hypothetical protein
MSKYYESVGKKVFNYLPLSFHIKKGISDEEYNIFNHPQAFGTTDSDLKQSPPRSLKKSKIGE